jgi:Ferritin-like domain
MLSPSDTKLLAFAQTLELATRDIYATVLTRKSLSDDESALLEQFHAHHVAYEQTLNGLLSKNAANKRDEAIYASFSAKLSEAQNIWVALLEIENIMIASHTKAIETIESAKIAALIASIIIVEARHAAILASQTTTNISTALDNNTSALVAS